MNKFWLPKHTLYTVKQSQYNPPKYALKAIPWIITKKNYGKFQMRNIKGISNWNDDKLTDDFLTKCSKRIKDRTIISLKNAELNDILNEHNLREYWKKIKNQINDKFDEVQKQYTKDCRESGARPDKNDPKYNIFGMSVM